MVDIAASLWTEASITSIKLDHNLAAKAKFLQDVALALLKLKNQPDGAKQAKSSFKPEDNCLYHEHGTENPCYKTMFD